MKQIALLLWCGCAGPMLAAEPAGLRFQHMRLDEKPPQNPWIKIVGDLNADGGYNTVAGAAVDIDNDGDLDIALGGVVWFENPGSISDPSKGRWAAHDVEKRRGHDLLAADLDGDGRVDLVMRDQSAFGSKGGHRIFLYKQITPDKWTARELRCGEGEGVAVADLNGDGKPDIVIGESWFENSGDLLHGPWTEHVFSTEWNYTPSCQSCYPVKICPRIPFITAWTTFVANQKPILQSTFPAGGKP